MSSAAPAGSDLVLVDPHGRLPVGLRRVLEEAGVRVVVAPAPGAAAAAFAVRQGVRLTRRERQVLTQLAEGATGEEVALRLLVSPETVRSHVRNAMLKLGVRTRTAAVVEALRLGLLEAV